MSGDDVTIEITLPGGWCELIELEGDLSDMVMEIISQWVEAAEEYEHSRQS